MTQRPSELSETILSQCNTLFALRMSNDRDQEFVRRALPDSAAGLLTALPALRTQEAVVVGEGVSLPMRIRFAHLPEERRPRSTTAPFSSAWQDEVDPTLQVDQVIRRWRQQARPRPTQKPTGIAATGSPGTGSPGTGSQGASTPSASPPTAAAQKTGTVIRKAPVPPPQSAAPAAPPPEESPAGHAVRQRVTRVFGRGR